MFSDDKQKKFFGPPADASLEAYKAWIRGITAELGGTDDLTDVEWEAGWREFWSCDAPEATNDSSRTSGGNMRNEPTELLLTERFTRALEYTRQIHRECRKGTRVPYLTHLLSVAAIVMGENGNLSFPVTEDIVIAALLHDVAEDHGGLVRLRDVEREFGPDVASIVQGCSDTLVEDASQKEEWAQRKAAYLERLPRESPGTLLVSAADKLDNARSILADYRTIGPEVWRRFKAGRDRQLELYKKLVAIYRVAGPNRIVEELERVVAELEDLTKAASPSPR